MKMLITLMTMLAGFAYGFDEYQEKLPWEMNMELADWGKVRCSDRVGLAKLVSFDPARTNESGVKVDLQFANMMKGGDGELEVIIPHSMRDPANMPSSWENLRKRDPGSPWKWQAGKSYGFLCTLDPEKKTWMVNWAIPQDMWNEFKYNVQRQKTDFEALIREKKQEIQGIDQIWREKLRNGEVSRQEAEEIRKSNLNHIKELRGMMSEEGAKYRIIKYDLYNPDETWP
jgi:hypothetical protein